jgi:GNAT superfamily N-acetyltransferase
MTPESTDLDISGPAVRQVAASEAESAAATLARAFLDGPIARWLVADAKPRWEVSQQYCSRWVGNALRAPGRAVVDTTGPVDTIGPLASAAVWYHVDPGHTPRFEIDATDHAMSRLLGDTLWRFHALDQTLQEVLPTGLTMPWTYLALLGVAPDQQTQQLGTALLRHRHAQLDQDGRAAFVLLPSQRCVRLFLRLGYQTRWPGAICPAPGAPEMFPMLRTPRRPTGHH